MNIPPSEIYQCRCGEWNMKNRAKCLRCLTPRCDGATGASAFGDEDREAKLHARILGYCMDRKWIAFHCSMAHKSYATVGQPDFIIAADRGRTFFIECKSSAGKLRPEQAAIVRQAELLGHKVHVVRNFKSFTELVEG